MDKRTPSHELTAASPGESDAAQRRTRMVGYLLLVATSLGWGLNWPVTKHLLTELPPLSLRGLSGVVGAGLLAVLALIFRQSLKVPRAQWPRQERIFAADMVGRGLFPGPWDAEVVPHLSAAAAGGGR